RATRALPSFPTRRSSDLVRTDFLPALTAVGRLVHVLAADVNPVPVVRRHRERRVPHEPILQIRRGTVGVLGPHLDVAQKPTALLDRKSTRLNSSHVKISY